MNTSRRQFLVKGSAFLGAAAFAAQFAPRAGAAPAIRVGACDTSMKATDPTSFGIAKNIGLEGVEIFAGDAADTLKIADAAYRAECKAEMAKHGIVVPSVMMGLLNRAPLASDPRGPAWLEQAIDATADLGGKVILVAFFGDGDLREGDALRMKDIEIAAERIKAAAPKAQQAGITLGIENTLSAKDNLMILDRIQHDAVRVYYDVGNSTGNGYDVPAEIRMLGDRICQLHFKEKDGPYLGEGTVNYAPIAESIAAINYSGWVVLETKVVGDRDEDFKKNAAYTRKLLGLG